MMRDVIHVITTLERGGAENHLNILIKEQVRQGYKVSVVVLKGRIDFASELSSLGVRLINLTSLPILVQIWNLRRKYLCEALIHSHLPRAEIVSWLSMLGRRNPWIVSRHNSERFWPSVSWFISTPISRTILDRTNFVIAISREVERYLKDSREISKDNYHKIRVVHYGIPLDSKKNFGQVLKPFNYRVGTAARLEPQKDISTILKSFYILRNRSNQEWRLSIAGSGSLSDQLQEEVFKLGLSESVSFLGKVENMEDFYREIDIFVLSSKYEGFGLVLLEAMIENIPIISSDIPTSKEILGDEHPAFFPKSDPYDLARLIERMVGEYFRLKVCSAYEERLPYFNSVRMADSISKIYQLAQ